MADFYKYRSDFPIFSTSMNGEPLAYLDTASSAQKPSVVLEAMQKVHEGKYSNVHRGLYDISQSLTEDCEAVRLKLARFLGVESERSIVFTRNTTDAINLVAHSWGRANLQAGDEIILTEMEHHANIVPWQLLQKDIGFSIKVIPLDSNGVLDLGAYESLLSPRTKFVGCVHVSNALGSVNSVTYIIGLANKFNPEIKVLVDGSQSVVHGPVNVKNLDCDFFTCTGHKLYGPTGIGVLYAKYEVLENMLPYQGGGDMIDQVSFTGTSYREPPYRFEAGTPPIVQIIGLGAAVDYLVDIGMDNIARHESELLFYATEKLKALSGLTIYGPDLADKAGVISFTMDSAHPSDVAMVLNKCGVAVRTGHHCCMPLMESMGLEGTVRASFGLYSNKDDVDQMVNGLYKVEELFG